MRFWGLLLCSLSVLCAAFAAEEKETSPEAGVLIVTYNTGRNAERLDRIRFRLVNEHREQRMLPQAGQFLDSPASQSRRVIVRNLPVGRYTLEFIIPNFDGLFSEIPQREIFVAPGEITKVDQAIKPRYARVKATAIMPDGSVSPRILLCNKQGMQVARGNQGDLVSSNLIPGEYTIIFERKAGYREPEPICISVASGAILGPFERHYVPLNEKVTEQISKPASRLLAKANLREARESLAPQAVAGDAPLLPKASAVSIVADAPAEIAPRPLRQFTPGVTESQLTSPECQHCPDHCKNRFWTNFDAETCGLLPCCVDLHELYGEGSVSLKEEEAAGEVLWEPAEQGGQVP